MNKALTPADLMQMNAGLPLKDAIDALAQSRGLDLAQLASTFLAFPRTLPLTNWTASHLRVTPALVNAFSKAQMDTTILASEGALDEDELLVLLDEFHTVPHFLPTLEAIIRKKKGDSGRKPSPLGGKSFFLRDEYFSLALIEDFKEIYVSKRDDKGIFRPATQAAFDKAMSRLLAKHRNDILPLLRLLYAEWAYNRVFGAFFLRMESPDLIANLLDPMFDEFTQSGLRIQEGSLAEILEDQKSPDQALSAINVDDRLLRKLDELRGPLNERFSIEIPSPAQDVSDVVSKGLQQDGFLRLIEDHENAGCKDPYTWWTPVKAMRPEYHSEILDLDFLDEADVARQDYFGGVNVGELLDFLSLDNAYRILPYLRWMGLRCPAQVAMSIALFEHRSRFRLADDIWSFFANKDQIIDLYGRSKAEIEQHTQEVRERVSRLNTVAERVKHARTLAGMSQSKLAKATAVSSSTVSWWETGRSQPSDTVIEIMAGLFDVDSAWLKNGSPAPSESPGKKSNRRRKDRRSGSTPDACAPLQGADKGKPEVNEWDEVLPPHAQSQPPAADEMPSPVEINPEEPVASDTPKTPGPRLSLAARTLSDTWNNTLTMLVEKAGAARAGDDGIRDPEALLSSLDELRTALMGTSALYAAAIRPVDVSHLLTAAAHIVLELAEIFDEDYLVDVPAAGTAHPDDVASIETEVASAQDETLNFSRHLAASKEATEEAARLVLTKQAPVRERATAEGALAIKHATLALDAIRRALTFVTPTIHAPEPDKPAGIDDWSPEFAVDLSGADEAPVGFASAPALEVQPAGFLDMVMTEADKLIDEAIQAGDLPLATALSSVAMRLSLPMELPYSQPLLAVALLSGSIEQEHWIKARVEALAAEALDLVAMHNPAARETQVAWTMLALAASEGALFSPHSAFSLILDKAKSLEGFAGPLAKIAFAISQVPGKLAARMSPTLIKHVETTAARSPEAVRKDIQDEMSGLLATMRTSTINHVPCNQIRAHLISSGLFAQVHKILMSGRKLTQEVLAEVAEIDADAGAKLNAIGREVCGTDDLQGSLRTTLEAKLRALASIANCWQDTFDSTETAHARAEISSLSARFREACTDLAAACDCEEVGAMAGVLQKWIARLETLSTGSAGRPDALVAKEAYRSKIAEAAVLLGVEVTEKEAKIMANMLFDGSAF